jgi:SAM-dependent methyltransferase
VGNTYRDKVIDVVAVDPLAEEYVELLAHLGIDAPVIPVACSGEHLVEHFPRGSFDVAFALNALDHSADPVAVLDNMLAIIKRSGRVALTHLRNEGERNGYMGIHFWNIECDEDHLVIWNRVERHDVTVRLIDEYETECWTSEDRVHCVIRPRV